MGRRHVKDEKPWWQDGPQPELATARLRLRPFGRADAGPLRRMAGQRRVADTMISIPHPYPADYAEKWIHRARKEYRQGSAIHCAVTLKAGRRLVGAIELRDIDPEHAQAETSFWIAPAWQGQGYAQEALAAMVGFGFGLGLNRIYAHHMSRNPVSGRVLRKSGFVREGLLRQRVRKWGVFEDVVLMALLRRDWLCNRGRRPRAHLQQRLTAHERR